MNCCLLQQLLNDENKDSGSSSTCKMKLLQRLMSSNDFTGSLSTSSVCWRSLPLVVIYSVVKADRSTERPLWSTPGAMFVLPDFANTFTQCPTLTSSLM